MPVGNSARKIVKGNRVYTMATYTNENPTPVTGVVGTVLGGTALAGLSGLFNNGGLSGIFGGNNNNQNLAMQVAILQSEKESAKTINDGLVAVYTELRKQDKAQDQNLANLSSRVLALETAGPLKEQLFDSKIAQVYDKITCCCNSASASIASTNAALAALQATVGGLTKTVIPITNVCPQPAVATTQAAGG